MTRAMETRLTRLEAQRTPKVLASVWWDPDEPAPADWDSAEIQVRFPDCPKVHE